MVKGSTAELMDSHKQQRRDTFLANAADYDAARPEYPDELIDAAVSLSGLGAGALLLEVGCGTGQATRAFARRGFRVVALDRSPAMVQFARASLRDYPAVQIRCQDFEQLAPAQSFDALVFAASYHWLDSDSRVARCASHLNAHGSLIFLRHTHPLPYTGFFQRVQRVYEQFVPEWPTPSARNPSEDQIVSVLGELESSVFFRSVERRSVAWTRSYSTAEYLRLLGTYSDHAALAADRRDALLGAIGSLIDSEFGGRVTRPYQTELLCARRANE
jgi:SAM-dependent methyltransferase